MTWKVLLPRATTRLAIGMILLTVLGSAGCMSWHRTVTSTAADVVSTIDPVIDSADQARAECEAFGCEP